MNERAVIDELSKAVRNVMLVNKHKGTQLLVAAARVEFVNLESLRASIGREATDIVLQQFRESVERFGRQNDQVLWLEPGKAMVVLRGLRDENHLDLAIAKMCREVQVPVEILGETVVPKMRIGVAIASSHDGQAGAGLYKNTATALRVARETEQIECRYDERLDAIEEGDWALRSEVESAVHNGEFVAYFQPIVNAAFRSVIGVETFYRWHSKARGVIEAPKYQPMLKKLSLDKSFAWQSIRGAVSHCARWKTDIGIAVDVPAYLAADEELIHVVDDTLSLFDFAPERLTLEFADACSRNLAPSLNTLREWGVHVALDRFGGAGSSLVSLRHVPASELKIDRSLVVDIDRDPKSQSLVRAIIEVAKDFGISTVAVGVGDTAAADVLTDLGCDGLQGPWLTHALPPDEFGAWRQRHLGR